MWYPIKNFSQNEAISFLTDDFIKVVKRTKYLYIERKIRKDIGDGFFEPVLLWATWCDFLGALYTGDGKQKEDGGIGSTERSRIFIHDILGSINPRYKSVLGDLTKIYRHRLVHTYTPSKFNISKSYKPSHLKKSKKIVHITISEILIEMLEGIKLYATKLDPDTTSNSRGTLGAFNKARKEIR